MEKQYQIELRCRRRKRGESIRELAQDIRRLLALAYPGEQSRIFEHLARDAFLTALDDVNLELNVREKNPVSLDAAVQIAQRLEICRDVVGATSGPAKSRVNRHVADETTVVRKVEAPSPADVEAIATSVAERVVARVMEARTSGQSTSGSTTPVATTTPQQTSPNCQKDQSARGQQNRNPRRNRRNSGKFSRATSATTTNDTARPQVPGPPVSLSVQQVEAMQAQMQGMANEITRLRERERAVQQVYSSDSRNYYQDGGGNFRNPSRSYGEFSQNYNPPTPDVQREFYNSADQSRCCWTCGSPKHFARACPFGRDQQQNLQQASGQPARVQVVCDVEKNVAIKPEPSGYLQAKIDSHECECLLDTGSEVSLVPYNLVKDRTLRPTSETLCAVNGTTIPLLGEVKCEIETCQWRVPLVAVVSDRILKPVLGLSWLRANRAEWKVCEGIIKLNQSWHKVTTCICKNPYLRSFGGPADTPQAAAILVQNAEELGQVSNTAGDMQQPACDTPASRVLQISRFVKSPVVNADKLKMCFSDTPPPWRSVNSTRDQVDESRNQPCATSTPSTVDFQSPTPPRPVPSLLDGNDVTVSPPSRSAVCSPSVARRRPRQQNFTHTRSLSKRERRVPAPPRYLNDYVC